MGCTRLVFQFPANLHVCQLCPPWSHSHYRVLASSEFQRNDWPVVDAREKLAVPSWLEVAAMRSQAPRTVTEGSTGKALFALGFWGQDKRMV